jgi:hypothetical protein
VGIKVSRGYLSKLIQKVSASLDKPYEELLHRLPLELKLNLITIESQLKLAAVAALEAYEQQQIKISG